MGEPKRPVGAEARQTAAAPTRAEVAVMVAGFDPSAAFAELLDRPDWQLDAACRYEDPTLFFPARGEASDPAKAICAGCAVADECASYGLMERFGIWAGMSERQRRVTRRRPTITAA